MRAKEFIDKFNTWREKQKLPPLPPKQNLFHATFDDLLPNILQKGLTPDGNCKTYPKCETGVVYMTTSPRTASQMLDAESTEINRKMLDNLGNTGVVIEIDITKLDPDKFKPDDWLPSSWISSSHNYKYAGIVPANALKVRGKFHIDAGYYNQKQVQYMRPSKFN